jgi:hypothetical protein
MASTSSPQVSCAKTAASATASASPTGKEAAYGCGGIDAAWVYGAATLALVGFVATMWIVRQWHKNRANSSRRDWLVAAWACWVVLPPLWFAFEYLYLFKSSGPEGSFEAFKYAQDVGSKVWLGMAAALTALVAKSDSHP